MLKIITMLVLGFFAIGSIATIIQHDNIDHTVISVSKLTQLEKQISKLEIVPGIIVVKLKSTSIFQFPSKVNNTIGISSLDQKFQNLGVLSIEKMFKHKPNFNSSDESDISRIMKIQIPENINPLSVIMQLSDDPNVEYAEPVYKRDLYAIPNDPKFTQQYYLRQIKAPEAWDIQKGDSSIVIAIIDGGFDLEHEDLKANIWKNMAEVNGLAGVDDDDNGFIDDVNGWDFGENDADPSYNPSYGSFNHGTHCAGLVCAVADNGIGIAGSSWNCKIMTIKYSYWYMEFLKPYNGIIYAADNGADVISISWGGQGYLQWEQDIINYAYSKGAVIIASVGNHNQDIIGYPAGYSNVIAVASVRSDDIKTSYSGYGPWIDISSPGGDDGVGVISTLVGNKYGTMQGTSMATPITAGICGLIKSLYPAWTNDQIVYQLLATADNIDDMNPTYKGQLGFGRVNAFRAVTEAPEVSLDARLVLCSYHISDSISGNNNGFIEIEEPFHIKLNIQNFSIGSATSANIQLISESSNIEIIDGQETIYFPSDTTIQFTFTLKLKDRLILNSSGLKVNMNTQLGYQRTEVIPLHIGETPILFVDSDFSTGESGMSNVPDIKDKYFNLFESAGLQFTYWDTKQLGFPDESVLNKFPHVVLAFGGFAPGRWSENDRNKTRNYLQNAGNILISGQAIGNDLFFLQGTKNAKDFLLNDLHVDSVRHIMGNYSGVGVDGDEISDGLTFSIQNQLIPDIYEVIKPVSDASTIFNYSNGNSAGIKYSGDHKLVFLSFPLESVEGDLDNSTIRTELFLRIMDWLNYIEHTPLQDTSDIMSSREVTVSLSPKITEIPVISLCWRIEGEEDFNTRPMYIYSGPPTTLGNQIPAPEQDAEIEYYFRVEGEYYDWTVPVSAPDRLFCYVCRDKTTAITHIDNIPKEFALSQNYPNPFNPTTTLSYQLPMTSNITIKVFNAIGEEVVTLLNDIISAGAYDLEWNASSVASGVYFYRIEAKSVDGKNEFHDVKKMMLIK